MQGDMTVDLIVPLSSLNRRNYQIVGMVSIFAIVAIINNSCKNYNSENNKIKFFDDKDQ